MTAITTPIFLLLISPVQAEVTVQISNATETLTLNSKNDVKKNHDTFLELNVGVANVPILKSEFDSSLFPGLSLLFGQTYKFNNRGIIEYEIGAAAPTIATGKIGVGIQSKDGVFETTVGIRPFPLHAYIQSTHKFATHAILFSLEMSPLNIVPSDTIERLTFHSTALATIGWRYYR